MKSRLLTHFIVRVKDNVASWLDVLSGVRLLRVNHIYSLACTVWFVSSQDFSPKCMQINLYADTH